MNDKDVNAILEDPQKLLNLLRLFHQLIHIYDKKEMEKEMEKENQGTKEKAGLGDTLSIVLKDQQGNIRQNLSQ